MKKPTDTFQVGTVLLCSSDSGYEYFNIYVKTRVGWVELFECSYNEVVTFDYLMVNGFLEKAKVLFDPRTDRPTRKAV